MQGTAQDPKTSRQVQLQLQKPDIPICRQKEIVTHVRSRGKLEEGVRVTVKEGESQEDKQQLAQSSADKESCKEKAQRCKREGEKTAFSKDQRKGNQRLQRRERK